MQTEIAAWRSVSELTHRHHTSAGRAGAGARGLLQFWRRDSASRRCIGGIRQGRRRRGGQLPQPRQGLWLGAAQRGGRPGQQRLMSVEAHLDNSVQVQCEVQPYVAKK